MKTYYYLYQITNLVNRKIYIGVHRTSNLNDHYMGSGKVIRDAIKKYGASSFQKDILEFFDTAEQMYTREKEIVTDDFLLREDVYNLRRGGYGGFEYIRSLPDYKRWVKKGGTSTNNPLSSAKRDARKIHLQKFNKAGYTAYNKKLKDNNNRAWWEHSKSFLGKHHTPATKQKMSEKAKERLKDPSNNSQYGTIWINNGKHNLKIKKDSPLPDGFVKGRIMVV